MDNLDELLRVTVCHFWNTRDKQAESQGSATGQKDAGFRSAVTGGKHLDGFVTLCRKLLIDAGLPETHLSPRQV